MRGKHTKLLRLRSEREGIPCDEHTGAVDAIGAVMVLVLLSARSMQGEVGASDVAFAACELGVLWLRRASRAHAPALKATV